MSTPISTATAPAAGRLDSVLSDISGLSRSQAAILIQSGAVQVGGATVSKPSHKLRGGEALEWSAPSTHLPSIEPEDVPLDILYEDDDLIAVNKPAGMTTHPAQSVRTGTLVNALLGRMKLPQQEDFDTPEGYRPGIVHRLDKDTSGVIVVAKTLSAHAALAKAFKERETQKTYLAIATGQWPAQMSVVVGVPIGRHPVQRQRMTVGGNHPREAQTRFVPLAHHKSAQGQTLALVRCEPRTGRTHQIRVHIAHLGSPIVGDVVYGRPSQVIDHQALHAWKLDIPHPTSGKTLHLTAPPPDDLLSAWVALGGTLPAELLQEA